MSRDLENAFPVSTIDGFTQYGMTLRDYFAAKFMQAILSNEYTLSAIIRNAKSSMEAKEIICSDAYEMADAMLSAREERQ